MPLLNCPRLLEIFEDPDRRLSSTKFCVITGQLMGCFVIGRLALIDKLTLDMLSAFFLFSGGLYGLGRFATVSEKNAEARASQPAPIVPPPPAPSPSININVPTAGPSGVLQADNIDVKGENVNVAGK